MNLIYTKEFIRVVFTFILFILIKWPTNPLLLSGVLLLLDTFAGIITPHEKRKKETKTKEYQHADKIADVVSYLMLIYLIPNDPILHFFVLFRTLGVFLFIKLNKAWPLIVFFDFVKEYLVLKQFKFIPIKWMFIFMFLKMMFEFYFHTIHNRHDRKMIIR